MKPFFGTILLVLVIASPLVRPALAQDADALKSRARALYQQGNYEQAIAEFERALAAARRSFGEQSQKADIVANELAMSYYSQSRYQDAEPLFLSVLENHESRLGKNHSEVATCWNNLGALYDAMGDYLRAENVYTRSFQILSAQYGPDHVDLATTYNNLGAVYRNLGDSSKSVAFYLKSRQLYERQTPLNPAMIANVTNNLAGAYAALGQFDRAEPLFRTALQMREERLGPEHPSVATTLNNLASLLEDMKQFDQVEAIYQRALTIRQEKLGADHPSVATTMNNLASLYRKLGRYDEAEQFHLKSLQIRETKLGVDHPLVAIDLNNLAGLNMDLGRFDQAATMYARSLKIRQVKLGAVHPEIAQSLNNLGFLHAKQRQWQQAAQSFDQCRRIVRQHVTQVLPSLSENEQLTFLQTTDEHYLHAALALAFERREDPAMAELSAGWVLNAKGIAQQTLAQKRILDRCLKDPAAAAEVRKLQDIRRRLARLIQTPVKPDETNRAEEVESLRQAEQEAVDRVSKLSGQALPSSRYNEIGEVRRALPAKSTLIEIARFRPRNFQAKSSDPDRWLPPRYAAWIIPPAGNGNVKLVDLGEAVAMDRAVSDVRKALDESGNVIKEQGEVAAEQSLLKALSPLAERALVPWLDQMADLDRLFICPDAMLWLVPWSALPLADQKYAVEQYQIDYVVSGRDLLLPANKSDQQNPAILFADPNYDLGLPDVLQAIRELFPANQVPRLTNLVRPQASLSKVPRLPATAIEAAAIAPKLQAFTAQEPQRFAEEYAQETAIKAIQRPSVLVISTHGFFLADRDTQVGNSATDDLVASSSSRTQRRENPLLRCGLLLAGCNSTDLSQRIDTDDGVLTGQEILDIDLRGTGLVVLSACQTGIGEVNNGEGVAGLRQAFQLAGARVVMATLWEVPDVQTARLMIKFFDSLSANQSPGAALRSAQQSAIDLRRERQGAAHPFFWAAFTLTGQN